jgi:hypothetical protein
MTNKRLFNLFDEVGLTGEQILDIPMGTDLQIRMVIARKKKLNCFRNLTTVDKCIYLVHLNKFK